MGTEGSDQDREGSVWETEMTQEFRSIESMDAYEDAGKDLKKIGTRICGDRQYILYTDEKGNGWYRTLIRTPEGWKEEEIAIFGRRIKKGNR